MISGARKDTLDGTTAQFGSGALVLGPNLVTSSRDACRARESWPSSSSAVKSIIGGSSGLDAVYHGIMTSE